MTEDPARREGAVMVNAEAHFFMGCASVAGIVDGLMTRKLLIFKYLIWHLVQQIPYKCQVRKFVSYYMKVNFRSRRLTFSADQALA